MNSLTTETSSPQTWFSGAKLYAIVFLLFAVLYAATTQQGPAWQDAGIFQLRSVDLDLTGWMGLALAHPLLIVLGNLFQHIPLGTIAWRINMVSALAGAVAVANVALLVRRLAPNPPVAAWVAAGVLGLCHTAWWLSTICQDQTLHLMFLTFQLLFVVSLIRDLRPYQAGILGLTNGMALSDHDLALLVLPAYVVLVSYLCLRKGLRWRALPLLAVGWMAGASLLLWLVYQESLACGLLTAVHSALFGNSWQKSVLGFTLKPIVFGFGYVLYNFPNLAIPTAAVGLWSLRRRCPSALSWTICYVGLIYFLFAIRYDIVTQFMFFLPFYGIVAVLAGLGVAHFPEVTNRYRRLQRAVALSVAFGPILYTIAPPICNAAHVPLPSRNDLPFRDPARYLLVPWKTGEESALHFARTALAEVRSGDTIISDGTAVSALLWVQRFEKVDAGIRILSTAHATPEIVPTGNDRTFVVSKLPQNLPAWLTRTAQFEKVNSNNILYAVRWQGIAAPASR